MSKKLTTSEFISKASKIHNNLYNYSLVEYIKNNINVLIICNTHGEFSQMPLSHLKGSGCPICANIKRNETKKINSNFIERSINIHGNKYDYTKSNYTKAHDMITIICPIHGEFEQLATNHLSGKGCYKCSESLKESKKLIIIDKFLDSLNLFYHHEYRFNDCRNIKPLPFDRYIPELNLCIEYDGEQHFIPTLHWGGEEKLMQYKINDEIKTNYCKENDIKLLRIKYNDNVDEILELFFKKG